ncbi:MAG: phosphodiester glycosidase family protein [Lachnospiraceae bacterium]
MKKKKTDKKRFFILYYIVLVLFTAFVLLDTFLLPKSYAAVTTTTTTTTQDAASTTSTEDTTTSDTSADTSESTASDSTGEVTLTESSYSDDNIQITITEERANDTTYYVVDITVSDIQYLKTAFANNTYGRNIKETTSAMAEENNAILAINGDYYGFRDTGYVIRNGVLYRDTAEEDTDALVINSDGSMTVVNQSDVTAATLLEEGALQVFSFGPTLVEDGEIAVSSTEEVGQSMSSNPRTAIGQISENHFIIVVSDGRTSESEGLSLYELAEIFQEKGATIAYNLDGGGSSTLVFNGEVINTPVAGTKGSSGSERTISDIIYFGY